MKHYKDPDTGAVYAYAEDGSQDSIIPAHLVSITNAEADAIRAAQNAPTQEQIISLLSGQIQRRLDVFAQTRNYDGILSACTYVTSAVPKFSSEAAACVALRDQTWTAAYAILAEVTSGQRPVPSSIADFEAELPALSWPA